MDALALVAAAPDRRQVGERLDRASVGHADLEAARLDYQLRNIFAAAEIEAGESQSMIATLGLGFWMLFDYAWLAYGHMGWLQVKLVLLAVLVAYHFYCGHLLKLFAQDRNPHTHVWYRFFNEVPVFFLIGIVLLASLKPF